jgi:hypothetical protein
MGFFRQILDAMFGPTQRWVFVLVISNKPERDDLPPLKDGLGVLSYRKIAVYSSLEKAMHDAAWEANQEYWNLRGFPEGGFRTHEENARWEPIREAEKQRAAGAKETMLKPSSWRTGTLAFNYRIIANRVDRWAELPSDAPAWIKKAFG